MLTINNTIDGAIQDIEIKGNTVQDPDNLSDIKSVGELQEDGTYKMSILSCGKNLLTLEKMWEAFNDTVDGTNSSSFDGDILSLKWNGNVRKANLTKIKFRENTRYTLSYWCKSTDSGTWQRSMIRFEYTDGTISNLTSSSTSNTEFTKQTITSLEGKTVKNIVVELNSILLINKIQLEEGTVATPYEPYQGNKCDILLPCQLEKVGDVSDRLFRREDGVWGVEKNIGNITLDITKDWRFLSSNNTIWYPAKHDAKIWSQSIKSVACQIDFDSANNIVVVKDGLSSLEEYKNIMPIYVKYQFATPQFIPLPRDTQIQLNSFFGTTHVYMESGEVEGTIKCKIPKSLGATVQSLNNKTDILWDRIEAIEGLKDSQNMKYETDKGYLVCKETKNGVIDDLKIEGKTLVNIHPKSTPSFAVSDSENTGYNIVKREGYIKVTGSDLGTTTYRYVNMGQIKLDMFKPNTTYTLVFTKLKGASYATLQDGNSQNPINNSITIQDNVLAYTFRTKETYVKSSQILYLWVDSNLTTIDIEVEDPMIFEGDLSANPPSGYIEGLKSVGEDVDKIEVLSCNENLFSTINNPVKMGGSDSASVITNLLKSDTGFSATSSKEHYGIEYAFISKTEGYIYVKTEGNINSYISIWNSSKGTSQPCTTISTNYVKFPCKNGELFQIGIRCTATGVFSVKNISVKYSEVNDYVPSISDKKQILFYNENGELEPIQELHEWDSIEKHSDNKWYYHKRSGKVVLNGSENWNINNNSTNHMRFSLNVDCKVGILDVISDKFSYVGDSTTKETIFTYRTNGQNHGVLVICIDKSKLSTQDVEGFKQWLQANNVTVVYQLAEEEVCELAPLHLDSYANETLILCNSGAISPKMEFSITSHINELVKAYGERINLLEEKVYKYMVTQNRMQLASTYSADSVTFKVDYFSLCGNEENYDEDLYNLILNNILVGKDNYDYDKMFTMILDYASWNQISWEQFDILVGLMDIQHNPPVEELPTEDIIEEDIIENEETPVE